MNAGTHGHEGNSHASNSLTLFAHSNNRQRKSDNREQIRKKNTCNQHQKLHTNTHCVSFFLWAQQKYFFFVQHFSLDGTKELTRPQRHSNDISHSSERIFIFIFSAFVSFFSSTVTQTLIHTKEHKHICILLHGQNGAEHSQSWEKSTSKTNLNYSGIHFICMRYFHGSFQPGKSKKF